MIKKAKQYENEIQKQYIFSCDIDRNQYYFNNLLYDKFLINDDNVCHEFAITKNDNDEVVGVVRYHIYQNNATNFEAINFFGEYSIVFVRDMITIARNCFEEYNYESLYASVQKNHPLLEKIARLFEFFGGGADTTESNTTSNYMFFKVTKEEYFAKNRR